MSSGKISALYFHSPCFDGLVSAVLAWDFLETACSRTIDHFYGVNYDRRNTWLSASLEPNSAVVDFLYHPDATFWADHHGTTFGGSIEAELHFRSCKLGRLLLYDAKSPSCALLLWQHFGSRLSDPDRYEEMMKGANKTDSAGYASVEEAIFGSGPETEINLTLAGDVTEGYCLMLLRQLRVKRLGDVAALPEVRSRVLDMRTRIKVGLEAVADTIHVEGGDIAVYDATEPEGGLISRYSPYKFFPNARYSVGLVRSGKHTKVTAMRNPWRDFESVELGKIFEQHGGGGHQRVGSLVLRDDSRDPARVLSDLVDDIRRTDEVRRASTESTAS